MWRLPIHQAADQVTRAQEHIKDLKKKFANVTDVQVNLTKTFESFKDAAPEAEESPKLSTFPGQYTGEVENDNALLFRRAYTTIL